MGNGAMTGGCAVHKIVAFPFLFRIWTLLRQILEQKPCSNMVVCG